MTNNVICDFKLDSTGHNSKFTFALGEEFVNKCLEEWFNKKIRLAGFIHTHYECGELSMADIKYAREFIELNNYNNIFMMIYVVKTDKIYLYNVNKDDVEQLALLT